MGGDTLQKVWTGKEVSYRHLKVFGCLAHIHVAKDQRGKLDPKSRPCIFLGYGDDEFGYRVWDPVDKKVFRSRDNIFMEDKCCMPGRTSLNTSVYPTLLQRGGKDWMLGYTRTMITISTDGKTIQRQG